MTCKKWAVVILAGGVENFEKYKRAAGEIFAKYKRAAGEIFEKYKRAAGENISAPPGGSFMSMTRRRGPTKTRNLAVQKSSHPQNANVG